MFKRNSSDANVNAQRQMDSNVARYETTSKTNNTSGHLNDQINVNRMVELLNNSSSHSVSQARIAANPMVSVVASSSDLFGGAESNSIRAMNNIDTVISNRQRSLAATGNSSPSAAGKKSKKADQDSGAAKPKSVKRPTDAMPTKTPKKPKQGEKVTGEPKANPTTGQSGGFDMNSSDMSFERAAVVAALTTLYGATGNEKPTSTTLTPTNNYTTASSTQVGTSLPMMLPKQFKNNGTKSPSKMIASSTSSCDATAVTVANLMGPMYGNRGMGTAIPKPAAKAKRVGMVVDDTVSHKSTATQYPSQYDVLLGRGKSNKNHPGNVWFQDYIQANRDRYFNAPTNVQKRQITMEILETIRKKGRFLRRGAQGWVDVSTADVQQKVAHALQYRRRVELRDHSDDPVDKNPHLPSTTSQLPLRSGGEQYTDAVNALQNSSSTFDASAIALAMVNTGGNFTMPRLDAQTRQEQYKVNKEYYQTYLNSLQRSNVDISFNDARVGLIGGNDISIDDRIANNLQLGLQSLQYTLPQHMNRAGSTQPSAATVLPEAATSTAMSNALLRRLTNTDYGINAVMNSATGSLAITNMNPTRAYILDTGSATDEQQSSPPSSENLDSSGLHSLADVVSQLYSKEGMNEAQSRGYTRK